MTLSQIRAKAKQKTLDLRAIERMLHSDRFEEALKISKEHSELIDAIEMGDVAFVKDWIQAELEVNPLNLPMAVLRAKARQYGVLNINSLSKSQLAEAIVHARRLKNGTEPMPSPEAGCSSPIAS